MRESTVAFWKSILYGGFTCHESDLFDIMGKLKELGYEIKPIEFGSESDFSTLCDTLRPFGFKRNQDGQMVYYIDDKAYVIFSDDLCVSVSTKQNGVTLFTNYKLEQSSKENLFNVIRKNSLLRL